MSEPIRFESRDHYVAGRTDEALWRPHVAELLESLELPDESESMRAGIGSTYPTFVVGDVVVKFFGHQPGWRRANRVEAAAHRAVEADPEIAAPRLLARGRLFDDSEASWPFLVTERFEGTGWEQDPPPHGVQLEVAAELGRQLKRVHDLKPEGVPVQESLPASQVTDALARSSFPSALLPKVPEFLASLPPSEPVFVHADVTQRHVFLREGRFRGIIDWGDATLFDRHYELAQLQLSVFELDAELLRIFLDAAEWSVEVDFTRRALAGAMMRQAIGLTQHFAMDVFHRLPHRPELARATTIDELADSLFGT